MNETFIIKHRFFIVCALAVLFAAGNILQYCQFTGRIRENAARYTERERELEIGYTSLAAELDGERSRRGEAVELVNGIEAAIDRTGGGLQAAISLVRHIKSELAALEACLSD
jgi:hypothetical protein